jgi:molybdenum cofactor cytidylyltransferase
LSKCTTAAIILAAGASTRLGSPKQLVHLGGEVLLERAVRVAKAANCSPIIVVLGASAEEILAECDLDEAMIVVNADWEEGMGASIACGAAMLEDEASITGTIVMTCDQPAVTAEHLQILMLGNVVTASSYANRNGVPAYFPATSLEELLELQGDVGARSLLKNARTVPLLDGELDVDTLESLAIAQKRFGTIKPAT